MSWGTGGWGTSIYGDVTAPLTVVSAKAIATNIVEVTLSGIAKSDSPTVLGDALNPLTWIVKRLDTQAKFTILAVQEGATSTAFELKVLQPFASYLVAHQVQTSTLVKPSGVLLGFPRIAQFQGTIDVDLSTPDKIATSKQFAVRDLANPPAPSSTNTLGGTLRMTPAGDYATVEGPDLVRKLIIRRLITRPGEFFHLPNYGIGFTVKEPILAANLIKLRKAIEQQIQQEPEVAEVRASLSLDSTRGILTIVIRARLRRTGQEIEVPFEAPSANVVL